MLAGLVAVGASVPISAARAQNVILDAPALVPQKKKQGLPEIRTTAAPWPRLDPGAVFCRTEDDLVRLAANRSGTGGGGTVDCRIVNTPIPIEIVERRGPGRTEVQVKGQPDTVGWTDAWLPEKSPSGR
jgi:hypothetical protein